MPSDSQRNPLPFEPKKNPKKSAPQDSSKSETPKSEKSAKKAERRSSTSSNSNEKGKKAKGKKSNASKEQTTIPEAVSRRMITRMGLFSGVPTVMGMGTLVGSYFIVTREWFPLPNVAVLLVSMGFLGLGVLGLSYGVFSASWDERLEGSKLGWSEFKTNVGRVYQDWKESRQKK